MYRIVLHCENALCIPVQLNGSVDEIAVEYIDKQFSRCVRNLNGETSIEIVKCSCIEFLDDIRIPWNNWQVTVNRIYSLSPSYMKRHNIFYPFRVEFTIHYPTGIAMIRRCAYHPGMFDPQ